MPAEEVLRPTTAIAVHSAVPGEEEEELPTATLDSKPKTVRVVRIKTIITIIILKKDGTPKTVEMPHEEVTSEGEPAMEEPPFVQYIENIDHHKKPVKVSWVALLPFTFLPCVIIKS